MARKSKFPRKAAARTKIRKKEPKMEMEKGELRVLCPFCTISHPIFANQKASCGTILEVMAVQETVRGRGIKCVLCGETTGTFVKVGEHYKHDFDCKPGEDLFMEMPETSRLAALVYKSPKFVGNLLHKWTGIGSYAIHEAENGVRTDKILGYHFRKV